MGYLDKKISTIGDKELLVMNDSVNFLIETYSEETNKKVFLLARQYRVAVGKETLGLFGGNIELGELTTTTLIRELVEETNIGEREVKSIEYLFKNQPVSNGYCSESTNLIVVKTFNSYEQLKPTLKCIDAEESIEIVPFYFSTPEELEALLKESKCIKFTLLLTELIKRYYKNKKAWRSK